MTRQKFAWLAPKAMLTTTAGAVGTERTMIAGDEIVAADEARETVDRVAAIALDQLGAPKRPRRKCIQAETTVPIIA
jgi:hypothetical protein